MEIDDAHGGTLPDIFRGVASPASRALRIVLRALLAACALKVWHLLILRLELERPGVFAAWLVALLLIWAATVRPARSTFLAGVSFLILVFAFHWGYERAASDEERPRSAFVNRLEERELVEFAGFHAPIIWRAWHPSTCDFSA